MWKKFIVLVLEFISSLAGNLIAGWIQQDVWLNFFSSERIVGTLGGTIGMLFFIARYKIAQQSQIIIRV